MAVNQPSDLTPSQTIGPFFHYGLPWKGGADLVGSSALGARADLFPARDYVLAMPLERKYQAGIKIEVSGRVVDGAGAPVPDAMIEIWQADHVGRFDYEGGSAFPGFGRSATSAQGEYRFLTVLPGRVCGPAGSLQAPHIVFNVFARGLLRHVWTRLYFEDGEGNDVDPVLLSVSAERRGTLLAKQVQENCWSFDIRLQGLGETVFFTQ